MKATIVSPSAPSTHTPERRAQFETGLVNLKALGVEYALATHAAEATSFVAATAEERLGDLLAAYKDGSSDVILAANGGWNSGDLLGGMEWDVVRANPKPLVGFSDITVLLNAIHSATHQIQIHGPMVTWGLAENDERTNALFLEAVRDKHSEMPFEGCGEFLRGIELQGVGVGGNLISLETLLGTPYEPDWQGKIFFWEETEETLYRVLRSLTHFKNAGVWERIGGMVIGHLNRIDGKFADTETDPLAAILKQLAPYDFSILKTDLFGHGVKTQLCLPVGGRISIDEERISLGF